MSAAAWPSTAASTPLLWRVGFVGLTLAGGAGVLLYLLLWVLMPPAAAAAVEPLSPLEQLVRRLHAAVSGSPGRRPAALSPAGRSLSPTRRSRHTPGSRTTRTGRPR